MRSRMVAGVIVVDRELVAQVESPRVSLLASCSLLLFTPICYCFQYSSITHNDGRVVEE